MRLQIGFTGTQVGMTAYQRELMRNKLHNLKIQGFQYVHHGDCIGADSEFHDLALSYDFQIVIHPPISSAKRACRFDVYTQIVEAKDYITRNRDIVDACSVLLATPKEMTETIRSGTWSTIRYARQMKKEVIILYPEKI